MAVKITILVLLSCVGAELYNVSNKAKELPKGVSSAKISILILDRRGRLDEIAWNYQCD
jgi:hypothetical protein